MKPLRIGLLTLGALMMARGAALLLTDVSPGQWIRVGIWLAAGIVAHDALLAPAATGLGRTVLPRLPAGTGPAARAAWLALVSVLLIGAPLLVGARHRADPSVIPGHPLLNVTLALALLLGGCALAAGWVRLQAVRRARKVRPPTRHSSTGT
jgi:hypothetical protein